MYFLAQDGGQTLLPCEIFLITVPQITKIISIDPYYFF